MDQQTTSQLVFFIVIALVIGLRLWRGSRARKLRIETMWIRPVIICVFLGTSIAAQPPPLDAPTLIALAVATALGFVLGWFRGRMVRVSIDVETHALTSQSSPWGMMIFLGLMIFRMSIRLALKGAEDFNGIPVIVIVDGLTLFYAASVFGLQIDIFLRARKLLADAQAAKAAGKPVPTEITQDHEGEKPHG